MAFILKTICPQKIKDVAYVINLDEYEVVGTHWIALFFSGSEIVYFDSFCDEHVLKRLKNLSGIKT